MARFTCCLCLFLTLWMAGSRRPAITRTVDDDPWWGTKEAVEVSQAADRYRSSGDYAALERVERSAYGRARRAGREPVALRYLIAIGASQLLQSQFQAALNTFLEARTLATRLHGAAELGAIAVNLSSTYLQVWDAEAALEAAEAGIAASEAPGAHYFRLPLLLQLGRLHQELGDGRAAEYFLQAIEEARSRDDPVTEARAWDQLGEERLRQREIELAERDFAGAFRLRLRADRAELRFSYARLGAVKAARGEWTEAEAFTRRALEGHGPGLPEYLLMHQLGEIRLARGDRREALEDFSAAIEQADQWRRQVPAWGGALIGTNVALENRIFRSFIETAAAEALRTGNGRWAEEALAAAESNRAASLREGGAAGANFFTNPHENFLNRTSLIHFRQGLGTSELFLSLYLGDKESYLWAVTRDALSMHRLPAAEQIRRAIGDYRDAVRRGALNEIEAGGGDGAGSNRSGRLGEGLYAALFGELSAEETEKPHWLLSLDDALFQLPFAALLVRRSGKMEYLVERHSVQIVPGALHFRGGVRDEGETESPGKRWFLGVGDAIYNVADARWNPPRLASWFTGWSRTTQLNRLVGSGTEVESCARSWAGEATVLIGADANRGAFLKLAAERPAVIHLATHVVAPNRKTDGVLAFGLGASGALETLSTAEIAAMRVPGAVVAMTGCESGGGEVRPGAGLLGLTRAWQEAGAQAVIATSWPVSDTSNGLFPSFYRHLKHEPAAEALRRSQLEMMQSGSRLRLPEYWAAFEVTGGRP